MARKFSKKQVAEWTEELRSSLKPGDILYTVLRSTSKSGMSRKIDVYRFAIHTDGTLFKQWLSPKVAAIAGYSYDDKAESIRVDGGGMDMGFDLVYNFSRALFPQGCDGNADGGYALKQEWL